MDKKILAPDKQKILLKLSITLYANTYRKTIYYFYGNTPVQIFIVRIGIKVVFLRNVFSLNFFCFRN